MHKVQFNHFPTTIMTFSWNACPFSSVPAQVKMSYAIQMEHYTYEDVLHILSFYV